MNKLCLDKKIFEFDDNGHKLKFITIVISRLSEIIFGYVLSFVGSWLLSHYVGGLIESSDAVTINGVSAQILNFAYTIIYMIVMGTTINVSQNLGRNDEGKAKQIASTGLIIVVLVSIILTIILYIFSRQILQLMNLKDSLLDDGNNYFRVLVLFFPIRLVMSYFNSLLICIGFPKRTLIVGVVYNIVNVVLSYLVLYTNFSFGTDKFIGVAIAVGIAYLNGLFLAGLFFFLKKGRLSFKLNKSCLKNIVVTGVPCGLNLFFCYLSQIITTSFIVSFGSIVYNAKVYIGNIINFSSAISLAIAGGVSVFIGRYYGRKDYDTVKKIYKFNLLTATSFNILVSLIVFIFSRQLIGIFTANEEILNLSKTILLLDIVVEIFRAVNQISDNGLSACGDVKVVFAVSMISCFSCTVLGSYILGVKLGLGLVGVWIAFILDEGLKAILYSFRWKSNKWKKEEINYD